MADTVYIGTEYTQDPVTAVSDLKSIDISTVVNGVAVRVITTNEFYFWDATSTITADNLNYVAPNSGSGNWVRCNPQNTYASAITTSASVVTQLPVPFPRVIYLNPVASSFDCWLPNLTIANGFKLGDIFAVVNVGSFGVGVKLQGGGTFFGTLAAGEMILCQVSSLGSPGTVNVIIPFQGMASQSPSGVAITGGAIDGTPLGNTTPASGIFSALKAKIGSFLGIFTHANTADRTYTFQDKSYTVGDQANIDTNTTNIAANIVSIAALQSGKQNENSNLDGLSGVSSTGLYARTSGLGASSARTITAASSKVSVTNGDGVAGNPTIDLNATFSTTNGLLKNNGSGQIVDNSTCVLDSSNRLTNPSQSLAAYFVNANVANVTGDGTLYTIIPNSPSINQGSILNTTTGVVTAAVTGRALICGSVGVSGLAAANTMGIINVLFSTGVKYQVCSGNWGAMRDINNNLILPFVLIAPMAATDTVKLQVQVSNGGSKAVGILGDSANPLTYFDVLLLPA